MASCPGLQATCTNQAMAILSTRSQSFCCRTADAVKEARLGGAEHERENSTIRGQMTVRTLDLEEPVAKGCSCGDSYRDERHHLSVLCFNVFAGSPIPFYRNSSPSLDESDRLRMQIDKIRDMSPDVICLQEMCSDGVERYYRESLQDIYDSFIDYSPPEVSGLISLCILYTLLAAILSLALHTIAAEVLEIWTYLQLDPKGVLLFTAVFLKSLIVVTLVMRKSAVSGFLGGSIKGSTMIMWKKERFSVVYQKDPISGRLLPTEMATTLFKEQQGDWLNLFRRRGYLTARLHFNGMPLWIVNTHLNLGTPDFRRRQIEELAQHCNSLSPSGSILLVGDFNATPDSHEVQLLSTSTGLKDALGEHGVMEPTWAARNPLTCGILIEDDHRCDFIFYRERAEQHALVNRTCRIVLDAQPWLSDHFGILLEATLCPRRAFCDSKEIAVGGGGEQQMGGQQEQHS